MLRPLIVTLLILVALPNLATAKPTPQRGAKLVELQIPGQASQVLYSKSYALVIGASDYSNGWPKLPGVKDDVKAIKAALEGQGFEVTVLNNPTSDNLTRSLKRFIGQYGLAPDNRLLIYYAGHGYTISPSSERQLGYIVPVDAPLEDRDPAGFIETALSMETMEGLAKQIQSKHALFVFDSCFSGSFFKMRAAPEAIALKTTQPVRQFITSGGADQQVPDVSIFRKQFVDGIAGQADLNKDGYVTGSELGSFLEDTVTNYSRRTQTPQYGKIRERGLDMGDFVFQLAKLDDRAGRQADTRVIAGPSAPKAGDIDLGDLAQEEKARNEWESWQAKMQANYDKIKAMKGSADLKAKAWERFLAAYPQDNPYSDEDDRLRAAAQQAKAEAERQPTRVAMATPPQSLGGSRPGQTFKDCADCPEMVVIPAGSFDMGSNDGDGREKPVHRVSVPAFALAKTEVTQGQWRAVMGSNPSYFSNCGDDCPVENVSWDDAQEYIRKLSAKTGQRYRLPSEAEWEYACRAGGRHQYCGGDNLDAVGWYGAYFSGNSEKTTNRVAQKQANAWGLFDMSGNVWEWVEDCYQDSYRGAPTDGRAWTSGNCENRVLRGGSWYNGPQVARSANRNRYSPSYRSKRSPDEMQWNPGPFALRDVRVARLDPGFRCAASGLRVGLRVGIANGEQASVARMECNGIRGLGSGGAA